MSGQFRKTRAHEQSAAALGICLILAFGTRPVPSVAGETGSGELIPLAVFNFLNCNPGDDCDWLGTALADLLMTHLARSGRFQIVERERAVLLSEEVRLGQSGLVSSQSAQLLKEWLKVGYAVFGNFERSGDSLRANAWVIDVDTGSLKRVEQAEGARDAFFDVERQLATKLLENFDVKLLPEQAEAILKPPTASVSALEACYRGMALYDAGQLLDALSWFRTALRRDVDYVRPRFQLAEVYFWRGATRHAVLEYERLLASSAEASLSVRQQAIEHGAAAAGHVRDWERKIRFCRRVLDECGYHVGGVYTGGMSAMREWAHKGLVQAACESTFSPRERDAFPRLLRLDPGDPAYEEDYLTDRRTRDALRYTVSFADWHSFRRPLSGRRGWQMRGAPGSVEINVARSSDGTPQGSYLQHKPGAADPPPAGWIRKLSEASERYLFCLRDGGRIKSVAVTVDFLLEEAQSKAIGAASMVKVNIEAGGASRRDAARHTWRSEPRRARRTFEYTFVNPSRACMFELRYLSARIYGWRLRVTPAAALAKNAATVEAVSVPLPGAEVFLDGRRVGTTPCLLDGLAPGQHVLHARRRVGDHLQTKRPGSRRYLFFRSEPYRVALASGERRKVTFRLAELEERLNGGGPVSTIAHHRPRRVGTAHLVEPAAGGYVVAYNWWVPVEVKRHRSAEKCVTRTMLSASGNGRYWQPAWRFHPRSDRRYALKSFITREEGETTAYCLLARERAHDSSGGSESVIYRSTDLRRWDRIYAEEEVRFRGLRGLFWANGQFHVQRVRPLSQPRVAEDEQMQMLVSADCRSWSERGSPLVPRKLWRTDSTSRLLLETTVVCGPDGRYYAVAGPFERKGSQSQYASRVTEIASSTDLRTWKKHAPLAHEAVVSLRRWDGTAMIAQKRREERFLRVVHPVDEKRVARCAPWVSFSPWADSSWYLGRDQAVWQVGDLNPEWMDACGLWDLPSQEGLTVLSFWRFPLETPRPSAGPGQFVATAVPQEPPGHDLESLRWRAATGWADPGTVRHVKDRQTGQVWLELTYPSVGKNKKLAAIAAPRRKTGQPYWLEMEVLNPGEDSAWLALALKTGPRSVYHELRPVRVVDGGTHKLRFCLREDEWKTEATKWRYTATLADGGDIREVSLLLYNWDKKPRTVFVRSVRFR